MFSRSLFLIRLVGNSGVCRAVETQRIDEGRSGTASGTDGLWFDSPVVHLSANPKIDSTQSNEVFYVNLQRKR